MTDKEFKEETGFILENSYSKLSEIFFEKEKPDSPLNPKMVIFNYKLAKSLGLNGEKLNSEYGLKIFSGDKILEGTEPIAQGYAGHQFGYFNMLGDGRAILLGEYKDKEGNIFDVQLKGAGKTPYSRGGDGKAALGPMLREYIISEAMESLEIPTTRSLAVVTTGEKIIREKELDGAILTRIASSHIRVGTFQFISKFGNVHELKELADYTINRHFKEIKNKENQYLALLQKVIENQLELIVNWQRVGFIHGVMNTDNVTISGETIDYGPCAFIDNYRKDTVFSSIDSSGRYAYGNQPNIILWNVARFAETLLPLIDENMEKAINLAQELISSFEIKLKKKLLLVMANKLGIFNLEENDQYLVEKLLELMEKYSADYTNTFVYLTKDKIINNDLFNSEEFKQWYKLWKERLKKQSEPIEHCRKLMELNNPLVIPRNHKVEMALMEAVENSNYKVMEKLLNHLSNPYDYSRNLDCSLELPEERKEPYRTYCGT